MSWLIKYTHIAVLENEKRMKETEQERLVLQRQIEENRRIEVEQQEREKSKNLQHQVHDSTVVILLYDDVDH